MGLWAEWASMLAVCIEFLVANLGWADGLAIVAFTLALRLICMPLSIKATIQSYQNRYAMSKLQPSLEALKVQYQDNPTELARLTMALYREKGIRFFDKIGIANMGSQALIGIGMFQAIKAMAFKSGFLWIANLAKPDLFLAILVGVLTFVTMLLMPGTSEQSNLLLFFIPALFSAFILVTFPSALGLYWATSSLVTLLQQLGVRYWFENSIAVSKE